MLHLYIVTAEKSQRQLNVTHVTHWMCRHFLQLNAEKNEVIVFGTKEERVKATAHLESLEPKSQARNLGIILDSDLNLNSHIKAINRSAYYHLLNTLRIKDLMFKQDREKSVQAFVFRKLLQQHLHRPHRKITPSTPANSKCCCQSVNPDRSHHSSAEIAPLASSEGQN